jgi:hypothetical protein
MHNRYRCRSRERRFVVIGATTIADRSHPMKYMMIIAGSEETWGTRTEAENAALNERLRGWWGEQAAAGTIVEGHELEPSPTATTVRIGLDGGTTVTDGPFVEGKEMVGGYGILDVPDLDAALRVAATWPAPGDVLEIRPVVERA